MWTEGVVKRRRCIGSAIVWREFCVDGCGCMVMRDMLVAYVRIWKARVVSECIWYIYTLPYLSEGE